MLQPTYRTSHAANPQSPPGKHHPRWQHRYGRLKKASPTPARRRCVNSRGVHAARSHVARNRSSVVEPSVACVWGRSFGRVQARCRRPGSRVGRAASAQAARHRKSTHHGTPPTPTPPPICMAPRPLRPLHPQCRATASIARAKVLGWVPQCRVLGPRVRSARVDAVCAVLTSRGPCRASLVVPPASLARLSAVDPGACAGRSNRSKRCLAWRTVS